MDCASITFKIFISGVKRLLIAGKTFTKGLETVTKRSSSLARSSRFSAAVTPEKRLRWLRIQSSAAIRMCRQKKNWEKCKLLTRHFSLNSESTKYNSHMTEGWHKGLWPIGACKPISECKIVAMAKRKQPKWNYIKLWLQWESLRILYQLSWI